MKRFKELLLAILVIGLFSCERQTFYSPYAQLEADIAILDKYLEENNIVAEKSNTGLRYVIHDPGLGSTPQNGNIVKVHYVGTLLDGTQFDSSYDRGEPFQYTQGAGMVIRGWEEGMKYIAETGKITLYIPSVLAYGASGRGDIGPNENLIFDIDLLSVQ
jgi:peptidylprolyl isomerase